jgi:hypothetical protein
MCDKIKHGVLILYTSQNTVQWGTENLRASVTFYSSSWHIMRALIMFIFATGYWTVVLVFVHSCFLKKSAMNFAFSIYSILCKLYTCKMHQLYLKYLSIVKFRRLEFFIQLLTVCIYLSIYLSIPVAPTWSIGYPWNASFHFGFLILDSQ